MSKNKSFLKKTDLKEDRVSELYILKQVVPKCEDPKPQKPGPYDLKLGTS